LLTPLPPLPLLTPYADTHRRCHINISHAITHTMPNTAPPLHITPIFDGLPVIAIARRWLLRASFLHAAAVCALFITPPSPEAVALSTTTPLDTLAHSSIRVTLADTAADEIHTRVTLLLRCCVTPLLRILPVDTRRYQRAPLLLIIFTMSATPHITHC